MHKALDPLVLSAAFADSVGMPSSSSRDVACLQLSTWLRQESATPSAKSGNYLRVYKLADALGFGSIEPSRWTAAVYLLSLGSSKLTDDRPPHFVGWSRREIQLFVLQGKARTTSSRAPSRRRRR